MLGQPQAIVAATAAIATIVVTTATTTVVATVATVATVVAALLATSIVTWGVMLGLVQAAARARPCVEDVVPYRAGEQHWFLSHHRGALLQPRGLVRRNV